MVGKRITVRWDKRKDGEKKNKKGQVRVVIVRCGIIRRKRVKKETGMVRRRVTLFFFFFSKSHLITLPHSQ